MRQAVRAAALSASLLIALVVAALPGTTSASSTTARPASISTLAGAIDPLLVPVRFADLLPAHDEVARAGVVDLEVEQPAVFTLEGPPAPRETGGSPASVFAEAMVVSVYGHPGVCVMGELGCYADPRDAVQAARDLAAEYEALSERPVLAALHLIVDVAQAKPGEDGRYLDQMPLDEVRAWVDLAREEGVLIFLDVQIGWSEVLADVQRLGEFLAEPHVHLAVDPEFATRSEDLAPGVAIGELTAEDVNAVQAYLAEIVASAGIGPKALVLHQFREDMLPDAEDFADVPEVEVTVDMDGWGAPWPKFYNYEQYAMADYAERPAIKLFFHWDDPLMTPADVMALPAPPAYVIYQ